MENRFNQGINKIENRYLMNRLEQDNQFIKNMIEAGKPFFIGRIAGIELKIAYSIRHRRPIDMIHEIEELDNNAGIHITNFESLYEYADQLVSSYDHCTAIAEWETTGKVFAITGDGQQLITERTPQIPKIMAQSLEPYYVKDSWMSALRGKRILIIHPFVKTIEKQLPHLSSIFPNREWFPECTIKCLAPPLTLAQNHKNKAWNVHLDEFLVTLSKEKEVDVALVAAGGYGMLISDYLYTKMNISVLYIGGALQLFFGIIGKRWFTNKDILTLMNDEWVRPDLTDKPDNFIKVEKGCYW